MTAGVVLDPGALSRAHGGRRLDALTRRLGHRFKNAALLRQALLHRSYLNENPQELLESNERLEFLGDAVLDQIISRRLYDDYPAAGEGWLTEVRSLLVRNETLAFLAEQYGLGSYIVLGKGIDAQNGRAQPAILGRTFEALIGAIYIDGGIGSARRFVLRALAAELDAIAIAGFERDPKTLLQEACQSRWHATPTYHTIDERGPAHAREFTVLVRLQDRDLATGEGKSKQAAEKLAAEAALRSLPTAAQVGAQG